MKQVLWSKVLKLISPMLPILTLCGLLTACINQSSPILTDRDHSIFDNSVSDAEVIDTSLPNTPSP